MTLEERRAHWRTTIEKQTESGMSVNAYCRGIHISTSRFYTWRRKLKEPQSVAGGFLELFTDRRNDINPDIRIHMGEKLFIEVGRGFDPLTLRNVIETLRGLSRCSV